MSISTIYMSIQIASSCSESEGRQFLISSQKQHYDYDKSQVPPRTSVALNSNLSAILPPTTTAALYPCIHGPWCMAPFNYLPPLLVDIILLLISQFKLSEMLVVPIRAIATILFPFIWAIISFSRFVKFFAIQWELVAL